jgi:FixJ family two-component response regulator
MGPRIHFVPPRPSEDEIERTDAAPASTAEANCFLLDFDAATATAVLEILGRAGGVRPVPTTAAALFARDDLHRRGCVVSVLADDGEAWSLPRRLYQHPSPLAVVLLVRQPEIRVVVEASRSGAEDVVGWPFEAPHLPRAVEQACRTSARAEAGVALCLDARSRLSRLTPGEREVMHLLLTATANKNIAAKLDIAMRTVEARRKAVFAKLGTRSTAEIYVLLQHAERAWPTDDRRLAAGE